MEMFEKMIHHCTCNQGSAIAHPGGIVTSMATSRVCNNQAASLCKVCGGKGTLIHGGLAIGRESGTSAAEYGCSKLTHPNLNLEEKNVKGVNTNIRVLKQPRTALTTGVTMRKKRSLLGSLKGDGRGQDIHVVHKEDMPVSESEKLGVTLLGRHFNDDVTRVPIKKRRYPLVQSPSPSYRSPSPEHLESKTPFKVHSALKQDQVKWIEHGQCVLDIMEMTQESPRGDSGNVNVGPHRNENQSTKKCIEEIPASLVSFSEKGVSSADFSGILILAAAACACNQESSATSLEDIGGRAESLASECAMSASLSMKNDMEIHCVENQQEVTPVTGTCVQEDDHEEQSDMLKSDEPQCLQDKKQESRGEQICINLSEAEVYSTGNELCQSTELAPGSNIREGTSVYIESNDANATGSSVQLLEDREKEEKGMLLRLDSGYLEHKPHWDLNTVIDALKNLPENIATGSGLYFSGELSVGSENKKNQRYSDRIQDPKSKSGTRELEHDMTSLGFHTDQGAHRPNSSEQPLMLKKHADSNTQNCIDNKLPNTASFPLQSPISDTLVDNASIAVDEMICEFDATVAVDKTDECKFDAVVTVDENVCKVNGPVTVNKSVYKVDDPVKVVDTVKVDESIYRIDTSVAVDESICEVDAPMAVDESICEVDAPMAVDESTHEVDVPVALNDSIYEVGASVAIDETACQGEAPVIIDDSACEVEASVTIDCNACEVEASVTIDCSVCQVGASAAVSRTASSSDASMAVDDNVCRVDEAVAVADKCTFIEKFESPEDRLERHSAEMVTEDAYDGDYDYEGYDEGDESVSETEQVMERLADNDSQYEGGKCRETMPCAQGEDVAELESETEHVDYSYSDCGDADDIGIGTDERFCQSLQAVSVCKGEEPMDSEDTEYEGNWDDAQWGEVEGVICVHQVLDDSRLAPQVGSDKQGNGLPIETAVEGTKLEDASENVRHKDEVKSVNSLGENKERVKKAGHPCILDRHEAGGLRVIKHRTSLRQKYTGWDQFSAGDNCAMYGPGNGWTGHGGRDTWGRMGSMAARGFLSQMDRTRPSNLVCGRDGVFPQGRRNGSPDASPRFGLGQGRTIRRGGSMHGKARGGPCMDAWNDQWDVIEHHSSGCYGAPVVFGPRGPTNAAAVAAAKVESSGLVVASDGTVVKAGSTDPAWRGGMIMGRGSPVDIEGNMNFRMRRRDTGFSPPLRRSLPHTSHLVTKSPSRSRTHCPRPWCLPRGRTCSRMELEAGSRRRGRSPPTCKSEGRLERLKSPLSHHINIPGHATTLLPSSRSYCCPSQASKRSLSMRNHAYRRPVVSRRSCPGRMSPLGVSRSSLIHSPGRTKHRVFSRPMYSSRSEFPSDSRRSRHRGNDDGRPRQSDCHGAVYSMRAVEVDGDRRRFRHEDEDCFQATNSPAKDAVESPGREIPRAGRKDTDNRAGNISRRNRSGEGCNHHFKYRGDGRSWGNFKSSGN